VVVEPRTPTSRYRPTASWVTRSRPILIPAGRSCPVECGPGGRILGRFGGDRVRCSSWCDLVNPCSRSLRPAFPNDSSVDRGSATEPWPLASPTFRVHFQKVVLNARETRARLAVVRSAPADLAYDPYDSDIDAPPHAGLARLRDEHRLLQRAVRLLRAEPLRRRHGRLARLADLQLGARHGARDDRHHSPRPDAIDADGYGMDDLQGPRATTSSGDWSPGFTPRRRRSPWRIDTRELCAAVPRPETRRRRLRLRRGLAAQIPAMLSARCSAARPTTRTSSASGATCSCASSPTASAPRSSIASRASRLHGGHGHRSAGAPRDDMCPTARGGDHP